MINADNTIAALRSDLAKLRAERDEAKAAEVAALQAVDVLTAENARLWRVEEAARAFHLTCAGLPAPSLTAPSGIAAWEAFQRLGTALNTTLETP
jgi:hypothetical protein